MVAGELLGSCKRGGVVTSKKKPFPLSLKRRKEYSGIWEKMDPKVHCIGEDRLRGEFRRKKNTTVGGVKGGDCAEKKRSFRGPRRRPRTRGKGKKKCP